MTNIVFSGWCQFGGGDKISDGQAIRMTILTNELCRCDGEEPVKTVYKNAWRKNPLKYLYAVIICFFIRRSYLRGHL